MYSKQRCIPVIRMTQILSGCWGTGLLLLSGLPNTVPIIHVLPWVRNLVPLPNYFELSNFVIFPKTYSSQGPGVQILLLKVMGDKIAFLGF